MSLAASAAVATRPASPLAFLVVAHRHRHLILRLAARRIEVQYRGSMLGMLWAVLQPLILLAVYTFTFSVVLSARWSPAEAGRTDFALLVFSGMVLYALFSKPVNEAPSLMIANQTYIKQLVFPAEVLPWASVLAALFDFAVGIVLWALFFCLVRGVPPATWALLPLLVVPLVLIALGASWLLSSLGVFLRDLAQVVGLATTALFFLSPILYPVSRIPDQLLPIYRLNPLVELLEASRAILFHGTAPSWTGLALLTAGAWLFAWLGHAWFLRSKGSFADVL